MRLRSAERTATFAWSPTNSDASAVHIPILLAAGSVSGALDASFSTSTELELFDLNLTPSKNSSDSYSLKSLGKIPINARFNSLAWSSFQLDPTRRYGILAGGMESGELGVWDPLAIAEGRQNDALLILQQAHSGPVRGLEFNPSKPNLLASGGTDGEIFVWDLQNPETPFSPGSRSPKLEDVTILSWNPHHEHILATASNNGYTVVWDLRARKELITLPNPSGRKPITSLAWHPTEPLKLVTAADDDSSPLIMVWDLKNAYAPERTIAGHGRGILSISWNSKDADMLLSCSKDNKVFLSNPNTGEVTGEVDETRNWAFRVQWCPRNPDLFAVASFDGRLVLHSLQGLAETESNDEKPSHEVSSDPFAQVAQRYQEQQHDASGFKLTKPPKWLSRPCGAVFGFGGKLVSFGKFSFHNQTQQSVPNTVSIRIVPADPELVERVKRLYYLLDSYATTNTGYTGSDFGHYLEFCEFMVKSGNSKDDLEIWKFLKLLFDTESPDQILAYLGFDPSSVAGSGLSHLIKKLKLDEPKPVEQNLSEIGGQSDPSDFASQLRVNGVHKEVEPAVPFELYRGQGSSEESDINALITRAVILGDYEVAVQVCLKTDRFADALVLAIQGGSELVQKTQLEYFKKEKKDKSYLRVLKSIVDGDLSDIVDNADIKGCWRDVFALVCTHAKPEDIAGLLSILGNRLEKSAKKNFSEDDRFGAILCYLRAGEVVKVVNMWVPSLDSNASTAASSGHQRRKSFKLEKSRVVSLQSMIEKVTVFRRAVNFNDPDLTIAGDENVNSFVLNKLYRTYAEYAFSIVELGEFDVAWKMLDLIPHQYKWSPAFSLLDRSDVVSPSNDDIQNLVVELKDRLYRSGSLQIQTAVDPGFPFEYVNIAQPPAQPAAQNSYYSQTTQQVSSVYNQTTDYQTKQQQPYYQNNYYQNQSVAAVPKPASPFAQYKPAPLATPTLSNTPIQQQTYGTQNQYGAQTQYVPQAQYGGYVQQNTYGTANTYGSSTGYAVPAPGQPIQSLATDKLPPPGPQTGWNDIPENLISLSSRKSKASATPVTNPFPNATASLHPTQSPTLYPNQNLAPGFVHGYPTQPVHQQFGTQPGFYQNPGAVSPQLVAPPVPVKPAEPARHPFGDRTHIPASHKPIVDGLDRLLVSAKVVCQNGTAQMKRLYDDSEKKIRTFIDQMNNSEIADNIAEAALEWVKAIDAKDTAKVNQLQLELMARFSAAPWIVGVRQLLKAIEQAAVVAQQQLLQQQQQQQLQQGPPGMPGIPGMQARPGMPQPGYRPAGAQQQFGAPPQNFGPPPQG
ncbi:protein transport protein S31, partial [Nowakowskiella sp. JEL0078]